MATIISLERRSLWGLPPDTAAWSLLLPWPDGLSSSVRAQLPTSITSLSLHLLCFLSQHTLWLIIAFTLLTAAHRSPQVALFDAGGIAYLQTTILRRSKHHSQIIARKRQQTLEANTRDSTSTNTARSSR